MIEQWDAALAWQILYHLMAASTTTAVPIARYLRGNHDFVARHLTSGLVGVILASTVPQLSTCDSLENVSGWGEIYVAFSILISSTFGYLVLRRDI